MKVRITETPLEHELDGVEVGKYERGSVREVSPSIGAWLITERYAEPEMRRDSRDADDQDLSNASGVREVSSERPRQVSGRAMAADRRARPPEK